MGGGGSSGRSPAAAAHGLEFPFDGGYLDAAVGDPVRLEIAPGTVCTGAILVGYRDPLADHVVDCREFDQALRRRTSRIPAVVWTHHATTVQVSELYRP